MRLIIIFSVFIGTIGLAQEKKREYFNAWDTRTTVDSAYYYAEYKALDSGKAIKTTYYSSNSKVRSIEAVEVEIREGKSTFFHLNGQIYYEANFSSNRLVGAVTYFYPNGTPQREEVYGSLTKNAFENVIKQVGYSIMSYYDSSGRQLVTNGNGIAYEFVKTKAGLIKEFGKIINGLRDSTWVSHFADGKLNYVEQWDMGTLIKGKRYLVDGSEFDYAEVWKMASPKNGMADFYKWMGQRMVYPRSARRYGIEGKVFLEFVVRTDGSIADIRVVRGIGGGCDEEAVRVISASPRWLPGTKRGWPIDSRFFLAVVFKLN